MTTNSIDTAYFLSKEEFNKNKIVVADNSGIEYNCKIPKDLYDALPETRTIEVSEKNSTNVKKFIKSYLKFVKKIN